MTDIIDRLLEDHYPGQVTSINAAVDRATARVERERRALLRPDGSPLFAPAEMQERERAILEAAVAEDDQAVARYVAQADQDIAEVERRLAVLDGFDPFDRLSDDEKQPAATRQPFAREDCEKLPAHELVNLARGALASKDRARISLYSRYIAQRLDGMEGRPPSDIDRELGELVRQLSATFDDGDRSERRRELEEKLRAARILQFWPSSRRRSFDGSMERSLAAMRQYVRL